MEAGESEALIFTKVDRPSRCTEDFARLIRLSEEQGWRLIVTEIGIDTRMPMGKAMATWPWCSPNWSGTSSAAAQGRRWQYARTRESSSVEPGRERTEGKTAYAIPRDLKMDAVPTARVEGVSDEVGKDARTMPSHGGVSSPNRSLLR